MEHMRREDDPGFDAAPKKVMPEKEAMVTPRDEPIALACSECGEWLGHPISCSLRPPIVDTESYCVFCGRTLKEDKYGDVLEKPCPGCGATVAYIGLRERKQP